MCVLWKMTMLKIVWPLGFLVCVFSAATHADTINLSSISVQGQSAEALATPESWLMDEALFMRLQGTLGATLAKEPGIHNDSYGAGAGRPIIRGQGAPRVGVLSDGASVIDASSLSPDHANAVEPLLARGVEVIRGPATLLYGSGLNGTVNVLHQRVATAMPATGHEGSVAFQGSSVDNGYQGAFDLTGQVSKHWVFHGAVALGETADYKAPKQSTRHVPDTATEKVVGTLGASWIGERGYLGFAVTDHSNTYGLPGHSHEHEHCHPHGNQLHCHSHDDHDHDHHHDHGAWLELNSRRIDVQGEYRPLTSVWQIVRLKASHTEYSHNEIDDDAVTTRFSHRGGQLRLEAEHSPWQRWHGLVGLEYEHEQARATGLEAMMPEVDTQTLALFALETLPLNDALQWQTSARYEHQWLAVVGAEHEDRDQWAGGVATGLRWSLRSDLATGVNLGYAQRSPKAQELYANGLHLATSTYECGLLSTACSGEGQGANNETTQSAEWYLVKDKGEWQFLVSTYYQHINDYIYGHTLDEHHGFRLLQYQQADVEFVGAEAETSWFFHPQWAVGVFADGVNARFTQGGNLPRIPARRYGLRLSSFHQWLDTEWELTRVMAQQRISAGEQKTPGHTELALTLNHFVQGDARYHVYLRGTNLLNQRQWQHASFLAHQVPEPGRNIVAGVKITF